MWKYKKKLIHKLSDIPNQYSNCDDLQIIYRIKNKVTGKMYIGKKILFNRTKVRLSLKKRKELKTRKIYEYRIKESNWMKYYGSSKDLNDDLSILGPDKFEREILEFVQGKKKATYRELVWLVKENAIISNDYYNSNILGRFFKKDIE